jgi:DNA-binding SARP family transcriptional activator
VRFRVLGPLEIRDDAGRSLVPPRRKQRVLLGLLLLDAGRAVSVDRLVEELWGARPPNSAMANLQSYVSGLRGLLGRERIESGRYGYALHIADGELDAREFAELVRQGREALRSGDHAAAGERLARALALWRGGPLEDLPELAGPRTERLEQMRLDAVEDAMEARLGMGLHADAAVELGALVKRHPLRERLWRQLMLALYRSQRQAEALACFHTASALLAEALGIDPSPELRSLHEAMLRQDPGLAGPAAPTGGAAASGTTTDPWRGQFQLPVDDPHLAGRAETIERVEAVLTDSATVPIVTVSGSPGVGKTALAVRVGHRVRAAFPDGQWYVRLGGGGGGGGGGSGEQARDPADVLAGLLRTSGQEPDAIPETLEERAAAFRARLAGHKVLLLLDDAADTEQVRPLLPGTAGCAVLITSRRELRGLAVSHAAHGVALDVLDASGAEELLAALLGRERTRAEATAAGELVALCARLPLALRIAAANLAARPGQPLAGYVARLTADSQRLTRLSVAGDRRAAVRAAFDHSYLALDAAAARLFRLLGLVPGADFTPETAAALDGRGGSGDGGDIAEAERLLEELADASLIQRQGADRFHFHDLLRLYAAEHAATDPERDAAWRRLCEWYLAAADAATAFRHASFVPLPRPRVDVAARFDSPEEALRWLESERANLVAVIVHAAEAGPHEFAWHLADTLRRYFYFRQHLPEWETAAQAGLAAAASAGDTLAEAAMRQSLALLRQSKRDIQAAFDLAESALTGYRGAGFPLGEAMMLNNLAILHTDLGEVRTARGRLEESLAIFRGLDGAGHLVGTVLGNLCEAHVYLGELRQAIDCADEALDAHGQRQAGTSPTPLINRAAALHLLGRYDQALADARTAVGLCEERKQRHNEAHAHNILALVHCDTGRPDLALRHARHGLDVARAIGDPRNEAELLATLGDVHRASGEHDQAAALLGQALSLSREGRFARCEVEASLGLALLERDRGQAGEARSHARAALDLARRQHLRVGEARALAVLGAVCQALGESGDAARYAELARGLREETGYRPPPA